jgi:hypothetical protein
LTTRHLCLLACVVATFSLTANAYLYWDGRAGDHRDVQIAEEGRRNIVRAAGGAVLLGCADTNVTRGEARRSILEARTRLEALAADGQISNQLYTEAVTQGDVRLARLRPVDCQGRVARFRATAIGN